MSEIARRVGVSRAAVSAVLNPNYKTIKISPETRAKIQKVLDTTQYVPNAIGQSLKSRRTGHIGFILADTIADGWSNAYFAKILSGVETICHQRGYSLNISRYNLSNIDSFVFPKRVGQRSMDGLVLAGGLIQAAVVDRFKTFGIPCVCVGDDLEVAEMIPTISCDMVGALLQCVAHAAERGHWRIAFCVQATRRSREVAGQLVARARALYGSGACEIALMTTPGEADYSAGGPLVDQWASLAEDRRATCLVGNDQVMVSALKELSRRGFRCPRDVGLISTVDSKLCEYSDPGLTSSRPDLAKLGETAAGLLIDHLEEGMDLSPKMSRNDFPVSFVVRESCNLWPGKTDGEG
ncbi:MAG: LacI family transcriptional regulator [Phycisphaerae bacterium]|nr:LacI family transcriptional regulator [Phycisphaerae bacterium]